MPNLINTPYLLQDLYGVKSIKKSVYKPIVSEPLVKLAPLSTPDKSSPSSINNQYTPPTPTEIKDSKIRILIERVLDDGKQTLGIMQVYNEDGTEKFELKTVELPYLGNKNDISCIPPGKYLVRPRKTSDYGKHFFLIGQEANNYKFNKLIGNGYTRFAVLIHNSSSSKFLAGCIGPGLEFSPNTQVHTHKNRYGKGGLAGNVKGNPYGFTNTNYKKAMNKLVNTLWSTKKDNTFYLRIVNSPSLTKAASPEVLNRLGINPTIGT